jgi:D-alanine transaminase
MTTVYLNGNFLPLEDACISVMDRGFLFGDGVYEVIPAYGGRLFRLDDHLHRLQNSLDGIRLVNPLTAPQWRAMLDELLDRNRALTGPDNDQSVYLQVTRGSAATRDHGFPQPTRPTVFATSGPLAGADPLVAEHGIAAVTLDDTRWQHCHIKAITLLPNVLLRQAALDRDAAEAILIRDGRVIEGSASNVFAVSDGVIITPPKSPQMLPGITRDLLLELAEQQRMPHREADIVVAALNRADEIWLTSSTREILPVTRLDGTPVGDGVPGPLWRKIVTAFDSYKAALREGGGFRR